jgi:YVTN family beta-propeller protein
MKSNRTNVSLGASLLFLLPLVVSAQWLETTIMVSELPQTLVYNPANNKVYCAIGRDSYGPDSVTVIDGATNGLITTITVGMWPQALVHNPRNNKVYCANMGCYPYFPRDSTVTVIDGATDSVIKTITVNFGGGGPPAALVYNSTNNKVYCATGVDDVP